MNVVRRVGLGAFAALQALILPLILASSAVAEPALWKVQGPHATVYLFGTVHVLKPTTQWRTDKIDTAFRASTVLYEEIKDSDDPAVAQPLILKYGLDVAHPLSSKLDAGAKAKLAADIASLGMSMAQLEPMRPWLAGLTLTVVPVIKAGYDPKSGVDITLKSLATSQGKSLEAFETMEQQIAMLAGMPEPLEVEYLLSSLDDVDKGETEINDLVDAWAAGDTAKLNDLVNGDLKAHFPELYRIVLADRNAAFAERIATLLKGDGVVFVAVGVGHLVGPDSVEADLAKLGYQAVRQ
jgi:uncharacterized protein YbaP (TraB family)